MEFLTYKAFCENAEKHFHFTEDGKAVGHWKPDTVDRRWSYHAHAINIIKQSGVVEPGKILEMGTMGAQLVNGSHTIDYDERWNFVGFNPTYLHDARQIPWPIDDKQYEWFVALRVFHHLWPVQRECFDEARRVARNLIIVVPSLVRQTNKVGRTDAGITPFQFKKWNNNHLPYLWQSTEYGYLY